ncbi:retrotransposon [Plasmodium gallinaceum]|uniref:Retrotransposon n=1 Tax=Plasmodium gallinaceum TaxID=5849 RepID=A0A1J1GPH2_PLAGA|nr:retrotransposon [Plasmodium gallinaceum]CRG94399.1 retrotransposon [Plasmodium gallinaceum]
MDEEIDKLGLKILEDIVSFHKSYVFKVKKDNESTEVKIPKEIPKLTKGSLKDYFEWFTYFEKKIKMQGFSRKETCMILQPMLPTAYGGEIAEIATNEDITNILQLQIILARSLFVDKEESYELMLKILSEGEKSTVIEATDSFINDCRIYAKSCLCMKKPNDLASIDLWRILRRRTPIDIRNRMPVSKPVNETFRTYMKSMIELESTIKRKDKSSKAAIYRLDNENDKEGKINKAKITNKCYCCGEKGHIKKDCVYRKKRCNNCNMIGHLESVCRNKVIKDKEDEIKGIITDKSYDLNFKMIKNETNPQKIRQMQKYLNKQLEHLERQKEKAKERYNENKPKGGDEEKNRKSNKINKIFKEKEIDIEKESAEGVTDSAERVFYVDIAIEIGREKRQCMNAEQIVEINGHNVNVLLCTGADICTISTVSAKELGIEPDISLQPIRVVGIYNEIMAMKSKKVKIFMKFTNVKVLTRFAIIKSNIPTILISGEVMDVLGYSITQRKGQHMHIMELKPEIREDKLENSNKEIIQKFIEGSDVKDQENKEKLEKVLRNNTKLWENKIMEPNKKYKVSIQVQGKPRRYNPRPLSEEMLSELHRKIDEMIKLKVISKVINAEWTSPIVMVKKKTGQWRVTLDYRYLNKFIVDDLYIIPHMKHIFQTFHGSKWFSKIDLKNGFWNIALDESSKPYTGFIVPKRGTFLFNVLPFGLKTSPTQFQRIMEDIFMELIQENYVVVYIDNIIILTKTLFEQMEVLKRVFELLRNNNLGINIEKCELFKTSITYLGQEIDQNGIRPSVDKVKTIIEAEQPKSKKQLRSFLGAANYYRNYIKNFSEWTSKLVPLITKKQKFEWKEEHSKAFEQIKNKMTEITYLSFPELGEPYAIYTDASDCAIGAVLTQIDKDTGQTKYIHYTSKKLNEVQQRWSTVEKELFAIVVACETFDYYIKGSKTLIKTDCKGIIGMDSINTGKLYRWKSRLSEFNLEFEHIEGVQNSLADWITRSIEDEIDLPNYMTLYCSKPQEVYEDLYVIPSCEEIANAARKDKDNIPRGVVWKDDFPIHYRTGRLYISEKYRNHLMYWFHSSKFAGHCGVNKTLKKIQKHFWWPNISKDIEEYVTNCLVCQVMRNRKFKPNHNQALSKPNVFDMVSLDIIGPKTWKGTEYFIQVAIDHHSRFMVTNITNKTPNAMDAISIIKKTWIPIFGCPASILTDLGSIYTSLEFLDYVTKEIKVKLYHTSAYYPHGNGINKSSHKSLDYIMKTLYEEKDIPFDEIVQNATLIYNNTPHGALGEIPYFAMFGMYCICPGFAELVPITTSEMRIIYLNDRWKNISEDVNEIKRKPIIENKNIKVGDIISYELSEYERKQMKHYSGNIQYKPYWSFPHRVTKVENGILKALPIYYRGKEVQIPMSKIKLLRNKTREIYEKQLQNLIQVTNKNKWKLNLTHDLKYKDYLDIHKRSSIITYDINEYQEKQIEKGVQKGLDVIKQAKSNKL